MIPSAFFCISTLGLDFVAVFQMGFSSLRNQWHHPSGVFSVLLLVRGDVIQKAVAQLAGGPFYITPVAFSFGWVSFGVSTLLSAIGESKLMPDVDCASTMINASNGYKRANMSWVLGRVLRDWELRFSSGYRNPALVVTIFKTIIENDQTSDSTNRRVSAEDLEGARQSAIGRARQQAGVPMLDIVWYMGILVMVVQCTIAVLPGILKGDWFIFIITLGGSFLALAGGALPQWRQEKWSCRRLDEHHIARYGLSSAKTIMLTRGNGHKHVLIICDDANGLNFEVDLLPPFLRWFLSMTLAISLRAASYPTRFRNGFP